MLDYLLFQIRILGFLKKVRHYNAVENVFIVCILRNLVKIKSDKSMFPQKSAETKLSVDTYKHDFNIVSFNP